MLNFSIVVMFFGKFVDYWIYGKDEGGVKLVVYVDVVNYFMNIVYNLNGRYIMFE